MIKVGKILEIREIFGGFFVGGLGFFCKFAEMLWFFFEKEIFEIFLII